MEDYKEKYEKALKRAKEYTENSISTDPKIDYANDILKNIFPELKESEDERIRKTLKSFFDSEISDYGNVEWRNGIRYGEIVSWLEKQGEQKLLNNDKYQTVSVEILDRLYKSEKELEQLKQGEQKPTENKGMNLVEEEMTPF